MPLPELARRIWFFLRRDRIAAELAEEMRLHVELRAARERTGGANEAEAAERARRAFGNAPRLVDESRDQWRLRWLDELATDLRFGLRALRRAPAASAIVVATLAVGIGATLATFTITDAALFRPLPVHEPERLVVVPRGDVPMEGMPASPSPTDYASLRARGEIYEELGAYAAGGLNLTGGVEPVRVQAGLLTPSALRLFGVAPARGRIFVEEEGRPDGGDVVVLSDRLWRVQFGADPNVVGRRIALNDRMFEVVGVMPPRFAFPEGSELWIPLTVPLTDARTEIFRFIVSTDYVARLASGTTRAQADASFLGHMRAMGWKPESGQPIPELHVPLRAYYVADGEVRLLLVTGLALLLLVTACANVCGLLLVRWSARRREIAVRTAVGAGRGRLVRQLAVESAVLAVVGAGGGVIVSLAGLRLFDALVPPGLAALAPPSLDHRALTVLLGAAVAVAISIGALPALLASRGDVTRVLKSAGARATASRPGRRLGGALVVLEVALAVVLLVGASLLVRSVAQLHATPTGLRAEGVMTARVTLSRARYADGATRAAFLARVLDELRQTPGFDRSAIVSTLPLRGEWHPPVAVDLADRPELERSPFAEVVYASADYHATMGIRLLAGRRLTDADTGTGGAALISASLAREFWPGGTPLGARIAWSRGDHRTIVGVVDDVRGTSLDGAQNPQLYLPLSGVLQATIVVHTPLAPAEAVARIRRAVERVDPTQVVYDGEPMTRVAADAIAEQRASSAIAAAFGGATLALAALGLYGLLAFGVAQRLPELGIRMALGAQRAQVVRGVVGEGLTLAVAGVVLGLSAAWASTRLLRALLHQVAPTDGSTFAIVPAILIAVALVAAARPALRAARVDPMRVLRAE